MSATRTIEFGKYGAHAVKQLRRASPLARFARGFGRAPHRLVVTLHAAQAVARHADHYFAMSDPQLARAGLSRETVPAALLKEFDARRAA